jgi:tetratricopeptide (TPR) repeat protein
MAKLARLPFDARASGHESSEPQQRIPRLRTRYYAFLSYSHKDKALADWLHRELERFRVPGQLAGKLTANGVVPRRLVPVFRDQHELSASGDLAEDIKAALAASQFLIVLCSPRAAKSQWTNQEIESFKRTRPEGCVLAAIADGEPFASDMPGREEEECFPPALRYKYDRRGRPTSKRAEPLAADFREGGEGKRLAFLKLVAGMLGVGLDDLVQRETTRRHRQLAWLAGGSLAGMAVTSTLAVTAIQARNEAREQRSEAEGLISFMLGDLKDKLEPIGRLDALDGVGGRVLAYYQKQDMKSLPDASLRQRASALSLMASVATSRGDLNGAMRLYREALAGTSEAISRKPNDPQRYYDQAQNVFYVGSIYLQRGNQKAAMAAFRNYKTLSDKEVALDPNNITWRMEVQNADANLGVMLFNGRQYPAAAAQLEQALNVIEGIVRVDPNNMDYQKSLVESLAWVGDSEMAQGHLDQAITARDREVAVLDRLLAKTRDSEFGAKLIVAHRSLGWLYASRGRKALAIAQVQQAAEQAERLFEVEPGNSIWIERAARGHLDMSDYLLGSGKIQEATAETATGCRLTGALVARDPKEADWRALQRDCFEAQSNLALASGSKAQAISYATQAVVVAKAVKSTDPIEDRYGVARAYRDLGDAQSSAGDAVAARAAWLAGLNAIPANIVERPMEMSQHQMLLQRLGKSAEAAQLARKLLGMGYREPEFRSA